MPIETYPPIVKSNVMTWYGLVYSYLLNGMMAQHKDLKYGTAMMYADKLTDFIMRPVEKELGYIRPKCSNCTDDRNSAVLKCPYCKTEFCGNCQNGHEPLCSEVFGAGQ